jgi:Secretion system C-terminal sorting domain
MRQYALLIVLCVSTMLFAQERWDEDCQLAESNYEYWQDSVSGTGVSYFCWVEEYEEDFRIKIQGAGTDQELIWAEPVVQDGITELPHNIQICLDEAANIYIYWSDNNDLDSLRMEYLQKVSSTGELLWGAEGRIIDLPFSNVDIFCDQAGGLYCNTSNYYYQRYWHIDDNGEIMTGWEDGIQPVEHGSLKYAVTGSGGLALFKELEDIEQPGRYFQVISAEGEYLYPGEGIFCGTCTSYKGEMLKLDDEEYLLVWINEGEILGNKFADDGLVFAEPVLLGEEAGGNNFRSVLCQGEFYYLCLDNYDEDFCRLWKYDENWQLINSGFDLAYEYDLDYVQVKPNGNVILGEPVDMSVALIEYNAFGELISPQGGWITMLDHYQYRGKFSGDILGNTYISRAVADETGQIGFYLQVLDNQSELLFPDEGLFICQNREIYPEDCRIFLLGDKTAYCWIENTTFVKRIMIQYVDNEGNKLLSEGGLQVLDNDSYNGSFQIIDGDENCALIVEKSQDDWFSDEYAYLHQVIFDDEPWLMWGEDGIDVTDLNGGNLNVIPQGDNSYLINWKHNGDTYAQLLVNGEFILEDDHSLGLDQGTIISITDKYCTYIHGNDILLIRWDENFEPVWDSPVWLTGVGYFDSGHFDYIQDGNLLKYWVSYEGPSVGQFTWRIKRQIITPDGEKLLGVFAPIVHDNGEEEVRDFFYVEEPEQIGVICFNVDDLLLEFMTISGEMITEDPLDFPELAGRVISDVYAQNSMLMIETFFNEAGNSLLGLSVYDLEGNSIESLPGTEFGIPYYPFSEISTDEYGIYYCWRVWHLVGSNPNQSLGCDIYAQEISLPVNGNGIDQIPSAEMKLKAYPNPFNPEVKISWQLAEIDEESKLAVFNIKGQKVREYNVSTKAGQIIWDGKDASSKQCASGVYLLRLQSGKEKQSAKLLMLK